MTSSPTVSLEKTGPIATLKLSNPSRRNPLSFGTMGEIIDHLRTLEKNSGVQVVIVKAEGPVFSAGHDLSEIVDRTLNDERRLFERCTEMMNWIQQIPQTVIAAVQGPALAAGCQLVATCDLAVATESSYFATPGVKIGLFCSTPMVAVSRAIGRKRALQMLLTGEEVSAHKAADWGLINEVVSVDKLDSRVNEIAQSIAQASPLTLQIGKQAFYDQVDLPQAEAYEKMSEVMALNAMKCDAQEGVTAFLEKRTPQWTGT